MDCNASDASVADWLEERFRDELKLVEGRQRALLTQLRLHLRQVQPAVHAVRVIPPELSGSLSPSSGVKTGRGVLRPPEAVKSESEQGDPGSVSRNASTLESQTSRDSKDPQFDRVDASSTSLGLQPISISKTKADDLQVSESDSEDYEKSEHEANMSSVVLKHVSKNAHAPMSRKPSSLKESLARSQSSNKVQRHLPRWHPSRVVRSSIFEVFFSLLILLQALCLAIETQYSGLDWGNKLEYNGYDAPAEHVWPSVPTFLLTTEMLFGSLFTIECMVKFCAFRGEFFCRLWNWFDLLLVISDLSGRLHELRLPELVSRVFRVLPWSRRYRAGYQAAPGLPGLAEALRAEAEYHLQTRKGNDSAAAELLNFLERLDLEGAGPFSATAVGSGTAEAGRGRDAVTIATAHASKGRQWQHVLVTRFNDGLGFPFQGKWGCSEDQLQEEQRLAYVATSRACETLTLSYVLQGPDLQPAMHSRFLPRSSNLFRMVAVEDVSHEDLQNLAGQVFEGGTRSSERWQKFLANPRKPGSAIAAKRRFQSKIQSNGAKRRRTNEV